MAYYKSTHPTVIAAVAKVRADRDVMVEQGEFFAAMFRGKPAFVSSTTDTRLHGLQFTPRRSLDVWTAPDKFGCQKPRTKLAKVPATEKAKHAEHNALVKRWAENLPTARTSWEPVYEAIGITWTDTFFSGICFFAHDGALFIQTQLTLNDHVTEILGSEYEAAEKAYDAAPHHDAAPHKEG